MSGQSYDSNYAYYATNGKENVNEIAGAPVKSRVKWHGPVLTVDADAERQGRQYRFHDEWWLGSRRQDSAGAAPPGGLEWSGIYTNASSLHDWQIRWPPKVNALS